MDTPAVFSIAVLAIIVLLVPYASRNRERRKKERKLAEDLRYENARRSATEFQRKYEADITRKTELIYRQAQHRREQEEALFRAEQERIKSQMLLEVDFAKKRKDMEQKFDEILREKLELDREMLKEEREISTKTEGGNGQNQDN